MINDDTLTNSQDKGAEQQTSNLQKVNEKLQEDAALKKARELKVPYVDLKKTPLNVDMLKIMSIDDVISSRIIPFLLIGKTLHLASTNLSDVKDNPIVNKIESQGYQVQFSLSSSNSIDHAIQFYDSRKKYKEIEIVTNVDQDSIKTFDKEISLLAEIPEKLKTLTGDEGVNIIDIGAMRTGASDVHYEPGEKDVIVRFRIDGVLYIVFRIENSVFKKIADQLKYKSGLKMNLVELPQDGRYLFIYNDQKIAVRVSTIPSVHGESFVCRYLSSKNEALSFEELGFSNISLSRVDKIPNLSQGMVLVSGPTGSGKSTTLYAILHKMNTPENKIITLEDPVEYYVDGITQSQVNTSKNYTFAAGLRSILRQDPDVVMVGEIRDKETANTAVSAALTGHVVLSTIHTNSAIDSIPRLVNMGVEPFMAAPALHTIVSQRLVRKVCTHCSTTRPLEDKERDEIQKIASSLKNIGYHQDIDIPSEIPKVVGCKACSNTGYRGRAVISEVLTVSTEIKDLILKSASTVDIIMAARKEGMITIREDGILKVLDGTTTIEEVHRVTNVSI